MLRTATESDLGLVAELIASEQADPARHVAYLGMEPAGIAAELQEDLDHVWTQHAIVEVDDGEITAALIGEIDEELGRVWWMGPFISGSWSDRVDAVYEAARATLPDTITQEEFATDLRHELLAAFALGRGFHDQEGSAILTLDRRLELEPSGHTRHMTPDDVDAVWAIHDGAFPGTHLTRTMLEQPDERHLRLVLEDGGLIAGYIVIEVQADNSGYIDYLAVAPSHQRRGHGRTLIKDGIRELQELGASGANLSVREGNAAARALYVSLGFTEERVVKPYRLGFSLD